jgi:hypothetical protein
MSHTSRVPNGFEVTNFVNIFATVVATAVEQTLSAQEQQPENQQVMFTIHPELARTNILDYSTGLGTKNLS